MAKSKLDKIAPIKDFQVVGIICEYLTYLGADSGLVSIISSWKESLENEDVYSNIEYVLKNNSK